MIKDGILTEDYDNEAMVPYAYGRVKNNDTWTSYEHVDSLRLKVVL